MIKNKKIRRLVNSMWIERPKTVNRYVMVIAFLWPRNGDISITPKIGANFFFNIFESFIGKRQGQVFILDTLRP